MIEGLFDKTTIKAALTAVATRLNHRMHKPTFS